MLHNLKIVSQSCRFATAIRVGVGDLHLSALTESGGQCNSQIKVNKTQYLTTVVTLYNLCIHR